jgi:hypothetical protein
VDARRQSLALGYWRGCAKLPSRTLSSPHSAIEQLTELARDASPPAGSGAAGAGAAAADRATATKLLSLRAGCYMRKKAWARAIEDYAGVRDGERRSRRRMRRRHAVSFIEVE